MSGSALRILPSPLARELAASKDPEAVRAEADSLAYEARIEEDLARCQARRGHSELAAAGRERAKNLRARSRFLIRHAKRLVNGP